MSKRLKSNNTTSDKIFKSNILEIGQWAVFKMDGLHENSPNRSPNLGSYLIGFVTGFSIIDTTGLNPGTKHQYKLNFVLLGDISLDPNVLRKMKLDYGIEYQLQNIEVLAALYVCKENGILYPYQNFDDEVLKLQNYLATLENPNTIRDNSSGSIVYCLPLAYSEFERKILGKIVEINSLQNSQDVPSTSN